MTFQQVTLGWDGKDYTIEPKRVMGAIALVEEVVTLQELSNYSLRREAPKLSKLAKAYSSLLKYAGCEDALTEEVYAFLFERDGSGQIQTTQVIYGLLSLMVPPTHLQEKEVKKPTSKKSNGRRDSSKQPTSSPADQENSEAGG